MWGAGPRHEEIGDGLSPSGAGPGALAMRSQAQGHGQHEERGKGAKDQEPPRHPTASTSSAESTGISTPEKCPWWPRRGPCHARGEPVATNLAVASPQSVQAEADGGDQVELPPGRDQAQQAKTKAQAAVPAAILLDGVAIQRCPKEGEDRPTAFTKVRPGETSSAPRQTPWLGPKHAVGVKKPHGNEIHEKPPRPCASPGREASREEA